MHRIETLTLYCCHPQGRAEAGAGGDAQLQVLRWVYGGLACVQNLDFLERQAEVLSWFYNSACLHVAVITSRVYISATLAPTSVLLLGCSTAGAPCLQASCHPPAPHWLRHASTEKAMLLFKLLTKRICYLILISMQVLPGGAAPAARAAAVGVLLDELAAAWRRYQHTLDCKRKAAQLSCVPRSHDCWWQRATWRCPRMSGSHP